MEMPLDLLKAKEIKKRLHGITQVLETVQQDNVRGTECIACCLEQVIACLRDHNSKITSIALNIIQHATRSPTYKSFAPISAILRSNQKTLWSNMIERLGDNKIQVRESAVQVIIEVSQIFGVETAFEQLEPCFTHKNWRTRQQSLCCKWNLLKKLNMVDACKHQFLDKIIRGLEDSSKDVRETAMQILEELYTYSGPSLWTLLQEKGVRSTHIKDITERCKYRQAESSVIPNSSIHGTGDNFARFQALLSSTKAKVTVFPKESISVISSKKTSNNEISSENKTTNTNAQFTERDLEKELLKLQTDLASPNDWERRVGALKALQMITMNIKDQEPLVILLSQRLRAFRSQLCEQIGDLRSSVSREACHTIEVLVQVLQEEFNSHAECLVLSLLKATCVTIQVISTSADKTIRSIIRSSHDGFAKILTKFLDGTRSKNQLLRYNCVLYMTMILQYWNPASITKQKSHYAQALPMILQDADSEVRAQARKCYWQFHHLFKEEAMECLKRLDPSVQRNVYDDAARDSAELDRDTSRQIDFSVSKNEADVDKFLEPLLGKRSQDKVVLQSNTDSKFQYQASRNGAHESDSISTKRSESDSASVKALAAGGSLSGPRRVLGAALASNFQPDSLLLRSTFGSGPVRVESVGSQKADAKNGVKEGSLVNPLSSTLRVTQAPGAKKAGDGESNAISTQGTMSWKPGRILQNVPSTSFKSTRTGLSQDVRSRPNEKSVKGAVGPKRCMMNASNSDEDSASDAFSGTAGENNISKANISQDNTDTTAIEGLDNGSIRARLNAFFAGITNNGWSHRLDALQRLSALLSQSEKIRFGKQNEDKLLACLVKELADPHYRVAQYALEVFLVFLRSHEPVSHIPKHTKAMLPRLFQKAVDSKELNRKHAREVLDFVAARLEIPILISHLLPLITDGGNVKMKVLVCQYMTQLLPTAEAFFKDANENARNIRNLLNKIAQALHGDSPLSHTQACGDLLVATKKTYSHEVDQAIMSLAPGKRQVINRALSSRGVRVGTNKTAHNNSNAPTQIVSAEEYKEAANAAEVGDAIPSEVADGLNAPVLSTQQTDPSVDANVMDDLPTVEPAVFAGAVDESGSRVSVVSEEAQNLDRQLKLLALKDNSEKSLKRILLEITKMIKTHSLDFWKQNRDRLLFHLVARLHPHDQEQNTNTLKVVRKLLERYASHLKPFLHDLVHQLMDYTTQRHKLISYIAESCLQKIVSDEDNAHAALVILLSKCSSSQPNATLITSLHLIRTALSSIKSADASALPEQSDLLTTLLEMLNHSCSEVRKNAVDCIVRYYYLMNGDDDILKYISEHTDALKYRLVAIYIEQEAKKNQIDTKDLKTIDKDPAEIPVANEGFF